MKRSTARGSEQRASEAAHLLEGIIVLDTASWVAGPAAATLMADFGAQVIKIEPPGGDSYREFVNAAGMPTSDVNYPWLLSNRNKKSVVQALLCGATFQPKRPRNQARNALGNLYLTRDGRWFLLTIMREEREWPLLARGIGRPELLDDPRFVSREARRQHSAALIAILDEVFAGRDWEEWRQVLDANRITSGPIARLADVRDDTQMRTTDVIVPVEDGERPEVLTVAGPICVADQPSRRPGAAPRLGQHTDEILRAAGYDAGAIAELRARKIIG